MLLGKALEIRSLKNADDRFAQSFYALGRNLAKGTTEEIGWIGEPEDLFPAITFLGGELQHTRNHVGDKDGFVAFP